MWFANKASHDTTELGLAWAWLSDHPQGSVCSSFLFHQLSLVYLRCNQRKFMFLTPLGTLSEGCSA
jgi:hypothetical protein